MTATAKTKTKTETAAEQYARLKSDHFQNFIDESFSEQALADVQLYEVKVPSGMVFKCRKVGLEFFRNAGSLPLSFMDQVAKADRSEAENVEVFNRMSTAEKIAAIQQTYRMVMYACVEPRLIAGEVNGHKNALPLYQLTNADFEGLAKWTKEQNEGGAAAPGLKTFRRRRK